MASLVFVRSGAAPDRRVVSGQCGVVAGDPRRLLPPPARSGWSLARDMRQPIGWNILEPRVAGVARADDGIDHGPADAEIRIRPEQAALIIGMIDVCAFVPDLGDIAQRAKAMRDA